MPTPRSETKIQTEPPGFIEWFSSKAEYLAHWIAAAIFLEFTAFGILKARYRTLWLDEIMGTLIARLPTTSQIWAICGSGADNQPPFYHYLNRASISLFGSDALGLRIPSVLGFSICCVCLYWFVSRRVSRLYGLVAMLYPALTFAWVYGTEGRPYALLLGCAGLAAVCWQAVNRGSRLMVLGLGASLLLALNFHYYSVLMFLPFWFAEAARTFLRKKVDLPVWLALTTPFLVLLVYLPVINLSKVNSGIPFAPFASPALYVALWKYTGEFLESSLVFIIFLGALYLAIRAFDRTPAGSPGNRDNPPLQLEFLPEAALVVGFAVLPVFVILFSKFFTHIFFPRYAITGIWGFAALIGLGAGLAFWNRKGPALALVLVGGYLVFYYQLHEDVPMIRSSRNTPQSISIPQSLPQSALNDTLPIVATNLDDYMKLYYYAGDEAFRKRIFYVSSVEFAEKYLGFTFHERMMLGSAPFFHTQVVDYDAFIREHPVFYVFGALRFSQWVVPKLMADGADLKLVQGGPHGGGSYEECLLAHVVSK